MFVAINNILEQQNKSIYWLAREIGCDYQSIKKLANNQSTKVSLYLIQDICIALQCTPNDIFYIEHNDTAKEGSINHPL